MTTAKAGQIYEISQSTTKFDDNLKKSLESNPATGIVSHDDFYILTTVTDGILVMWGVDKFGMVINLNLVNETLPITITRTFSAIKFGETSKNNVVYVVICFDKEKVEKVVKLVQKVVNWDGVQDAMKTQTFWAVESTTMTKGNVIYKTIEPIKSDPVPKIIEKSDDPIDIDEDDQIPPISVENTFDQ